MKEGGAKYYYQLLTEVQIGDYFNTIIIYLDVL
jgi:hypothetical protein